MLTLTKTNSTASFQIDQAHVSIIIIFSIDRAQVSLIDVPYPN